METVVVCVCGVETVCMAWRQLWWCVCAPSSVYVLVVCRAAALLFLWLLAMAGGLLFKRFMLGAKGWEQIPLLDWYKAFGNLEAVRPLS